MPDVPSHDFKGCHVFSNILILCLYGNPELKFSFSPCMNLKIVELYAIYSEFV